jgi:hypothetical protein
MFLTRSAFAPALTPTLTMIAAVAFMAASAPAQTSTTFTHDSRFPPVGLGSTETMQINVLNNATASSSGTAASCTGTITFTSATGTVIGAATSFTVTSGEVFSASLPFSKAGASGTRTEIVGSIQLTVSTSSATPCALAGSLETFDTSTGATHVFVGGSSQGGGGPIGHQ